MIQAAHKAQDGTNPSRYEGQAGEKEDRGARLVWCIPVKGQSKCSSGLCCGGGRWAGDKKFGVVQFIKGKWKTGERSFQELGPHR